MHRRFAPLLLLALLAVALLLPSSAFAWGSGAYDSLNETYWGTHDWIVWQAYVQAGKPAWFDVNAALLNNDDPDLEPMPRLDHIWQVNESFGGGAPYRVGELYSEAVSDYKAGDHEGASEAFGLLTHYYSDICQPFHTVPSKANPVYDQIHSRYESSTRLMSHTKSDLRLLAPRGRKAPTNVRTMTMSAATVANGQLNAVIDNFDNGEIYNAQVQAATKICLSRAVNDLADILAAVPNGSGEAPAAARFSAFRPYRVYVGQHKNARADARVVDASGNPLKGIKVVFTWSLGGTTVTSIRYSGADGYAYSWQDTGSTPYFQPINATAETISRGATLKTGRITFMTTPVLADGKAGFSQKLNDTTPKRYTTVTSTAKCLTASGKPVAGLKVAFAWKHKSRTYMTYATSDKYGIARTKRYIGDATKGYRVYVKATTQAGGYNRSYTTSFVPW